jgi:hypothetical protein
MKHKRIVTFFALAGMFLAILYIFQLDLWWPLPYIGAYLENLIQRMILACLLSGGVTVLLFHFKS